MTSIEKAIKNKIVAEANWRSTNGHGGVDDITRDNFILAAEFGYQLAGQKPEWIELVKNFLFKHQEWEAKLIAADSMWWPHAEKDALRGKIYEEFCELQVERNKCFSAINALPTGEKAEPQNPGSCTCKPEDKHGQTSVMCCNHCGMPDEDFWKPPTGAEPGEDQEGLKDKIIELKEKDRVEWALLAMKKQLYIDGLKILLEMSGCPEVLIENPTILNGEVDEESMAWVLDAIERHKKLKK